MTKSLTTVLTLKKLLGKGVGTNSVEKFSRKECSSGSVRGSGDLERVRIVRRIMRAKVRDAEKEAEQTRKDFSRRMRHVEKRLGQHVEILSRMKEVMQMEVRRTWQDGRIRMKEKVDFLEKKWKSVRQDLGPNEKEWRGIRYGDRYLARRRAEGGRNLMDVPLVYGDAQVTEAQKAVLALPSKFCTYEAVTEHKMAVAANVMGTKVAWELHARKDRKEERELDGEIGAQGEWRLEEEVSRQVEKDIFGAGTINFAKRYVTDIPTCRRLHPPKALPADQAVILENMKSRIAEVTKVYLKNCDKKGLPLLKNVSEIEERGIKEIKMDKDNVILSTDKSGRLAAQQRGFYEEAMQAHVADDPKLSWEDQCSKEKRITAHTLQWGRLLKLGAKWDNNGRHWDRVKNSLRTKFCLAPPMSGYYKDHKKPAEGKEHLGPKLRPVCGAVESSNGPLSHMLSEILTTLGDEMDKEIGALCLSTEEMCGALEIYNRRAAESRRPVIFSMDVEGMYPALQHDAVAKTCREEFLNSNLVVEEVDVEALGLYLAILYQDRKEELVNLGLDRVVQKRRHPRARKILMTTEEVLEPGERTVSKFLPMETQPTSRQIKLMLGLAIEEGVLAVFKHHDYSFGQDVRLQQEGAPIGLKISGAVGKVVMVAWVREFKARMTLAAASLPDAEQYLHQLYVDDNNAIMEELPLGTRLVDGRFVVKEESIEGDRLVKGDKRTAELAKDLANTICPFLQMTVDYPSKSPSGWMPILDLQVQMAADNSVNFKWFKKSMATDCAILNRSAMPAATKRVTYVQKGVTMLRNTRRELHEELRVPLMEELAEMMMVSGYPEDFRRGVIESAVACYERQVAASDRGEVPLYRPRDWQAEERRRKKLIAKTAWHRPAADTVMRVPCTPGAALAAAVRTVVEEESARLGLKVKVQEGAGLSLKRSVVTSDLAFGQTCRQGDCPLCLTGNGKGGLHHHRSGAVYSGKCKLCGGEVASYWGESGDSAYCRTHQHIDAIGNKDEGNAFAKHLAMYHPEHIGNKDAFEFRLEEIHSKPLSRLCSESDFIHRSTSEIQMNSKAEWHQPAVARVVVTRELEEGQGGRVEPRGRGRTRARGGV